MIPEDGQNANQAPKTSLSVAISSHPAANTVTFPSLLYSSEDDVSFFCIILALNKKSKNRIVFNCIYDHDSFIFLYVKITDTDKLFIVSAAITSPYYQFMFLCIPSWKEKPGEAYEKLWTGKL